MPIHRKRRGKLLECLRRMTCPGCPMIDAVDRVVVKPGLEPLRIFPQVMQQAGEKGFGGQAEWFGKAAGKVGDVAEVILEQLPMLHSRRFAIRPVGGVRVIAHG